MILPLIGWSGRRRPDGTAPGDGGPEKAAEDTAAESPDEAPWRTPAASLATAGGPDPYVFGDWPARARLAGRVTPEVPR